MEMFLENTTSYSNSYSYSATIILFNETTAAPPPVRVRSILDVIIANILTVLGIVGNTIALRVLWSCGRIRKSNHFVFIFNQSAADLLCCASIALTSVLDFGVDISGLSDANLWWFCVFVRGYYVSSVGFFASSYNLATLSLDRMFSVLFPIVHRSMSRRRQKVIVQAIWTVAAAVTLAVSLLGNGVDERGRCVYRSKPNARIPYRARTLFVTAVYNVVPFVVMSVSYATLVSKLNKLDKEGGASSRKNSALRAILLVIAAYLVMYAPRFVVICFIYAGSPIDHESQVYTLISILIILNAVINPLLYTIRYSEFRRELWRQFRHLGAARDNSVGSSSSSI